MSRPRKAKGVRKYAITFYATSKLHQQIHDRAEMEEISISEACETLVLSAFQCEKQRAVTSTQHIQAVQAPGKERSFFDMIKEHEPNEPNRPNEGNKDYVEACYDDFKNEIGGKKK